MIPKTTDDIPNNQEKLRRSIKLTKIGTGAAFLLIAVNATVTLISGPHLFSYAVSGVGLLVYCAILWRGYLAWLKLRRYKI